MKIKIDKKQTIPVYLQIAGQIKEQIFDGAIGDGYALPSERSLAAELGVHRNTVTKAYHELKAEGLVFSYQGKGYSPRSSDGNFAPLTQYLHPFRACILLEELNNANTRGSLSVVFMDEDGVTVIDEINATSSAVDTPKSIYTLGG